MTWVVQREVSAVDGGVVTCEGSPPRQGSLGPNLGSPTHYEHIIRIILVATS